jgi:hypothetical protein
LRGKLAAISKNTASGISEHTPPYRRIFYHKAKK